MDNWEQDKPFMDYNLVKCTSNAIMCEKVYKLIEKEIDRLILSFGRTNMKTVKAYAAEIYKANFTPNQVSLVVDGLINTVSEFPSVGDIKRQLNGKFDKTPEKNTNTDENSKIASKERGDYMRMRKIIQSKHNLTDEDIDRWTRYYVKEVYGPAVLELGYINSFAQIAVKDLVMAKMDKDRAIQIGKESQLG